MWKYFLLTVALFGPDRAHAQESYRLEERFLPSVVFQVNCRVDIEGQVVVPEVKEKTLAVKGQSSIDYNERILTQRQGRVERTVRVYRKLDFKREVGDSIQQSTLRPEARCLVIMRHNQFEVPFCPQGPLTWGEIDLVRTDVFTPALAGLLPTRNVALGEAWQADNVALQELTDLDNIDRGALTCKFEGISTLVGRRQARVNFKGEVKGLGEDGLTRHELEGYLYFDLEDNFLSYLYVRGTQHLLDKQGKPAGKIEGAFVLNRQPLRDPGELADDTLRKLVLEPNDDNTLLLYESAELGVRFLYPRRWRISNVLGRQITLDEKHGSGLLITIDPLAKLPAGGQFHKETQLWLGQQQAQILRVDPLKVEQSQPQLIEHFAFDAQLKKDRVILDYFVVRHSQGGATFAARLLPNDVTALQRELAKVARSMTFSRLP